MANPELSGYEMAHFIRRTRQAFLKLVAAIQVAEWLNKDASNQAEVQHSI